MNRLTTFAALAIFAISFYFGARDYFKSSRELAQLREQRSLAAETTTTLRSNETTLPTALRNARAQKQAEIDTLQAQLQQEKQILNTQVQNLANLMSLKTSQERQASESYSNTVTQRTNEMQDLTDFLRNQRQAEEDLWEATDLSLRQQSNQALWARDQIDQNIRQTEAGIRQTQEQIQGWLLHTSDVTLRESQLQALQTRLQQQQQQLAGLQAQRSDLSTQVYLQGQQITEQSQAQKMDMIESETEILGRITGIREELRNLQQQRRQNATVSPELLEQIQSTQATRNEQAQRVQSLEESLKARQEELSQIR